MHKDVMEAGGPAAQVAQEMLRLLNGQEARTANEAVELLALLAMVAERLAMQLSREHTLETQEKLRQLDLAALLCACTPPAEAAGEARQGAEAAGQAP